MTHIYALILLLAMSTSVLAWSRETHLLIKNLSQDNIITTVVTNVDCFDFEKGGGPQDVFQNVSIPSGGSEDRRIEVNQVATNSPFTMTLWFSDFTMDWFRINQKYALGTAEANFSHFGNRTVNYRKSGNSIFITVKDD